MKATLERASRGLPVSVVEVDISTDPELERRYVIEIPVLFIADSPVFRHRVGEDELRECLRRAARRGLKPR